MEQSEAFKGAIATIKELETRLVMCKEFNKSSEQSAVDGERIIEEHFAECFNALAARKAELLRQVVQAVNSQSMLFFFFLFFFFFPFILFIPFVSFFSFIS